MGTAGEPTGALTNVARFGRAFDAGQHCSNEVLSVSEAGQRDASDVKPDQSQESVGNQAMQVLRPAHAPKRVGRQQPTGKRRSAHRGDEGDHHGASGGIVTDVAHLGPMEDGGQITKRGFRRADELGEPRVRRSHPTPREPNEDNTSCRIAGRDMQGLPGIGAEPG